MENLTERLNDLWESIVKDIDINISNNSISLTLEVIENGNSSNHKIIFKKVSSHFYLNNIGENRLNTNQLDEDEYLELTSINYVRNGVGEIKVSSASEPWANQCYASANFVLEIWSKLLFVEARIIVVDESEYSVEI